MTNVYSKQVDDFELLLSNFKVASAVIHYDETSPHMYIVGIPIKYKNKYGMSKQIGKSDVFTKDSLRKLQDKMRTLCIEEFNKEYDSNSILKTKQKGRNQDINVKDMNNYIKMKKELKKHKEDLEITNKKSLELENNSKEVKDTINNLKNIIGSKEKYILKQTDKNKLLSFLEKVDNTNLEYKKIQKLSITLNNVDKELIKNKKLIKSLTDNNKLLTLKNLTLNDKLESKEYEIEELKEENFNLKYKLNYFELLFKKFINLIKDMFKKHNKKEQYKGFTEDLFDNGIVSDKTIYELEFSYKNTVKEKDNLL